MNSETISETDTKIEKTIEFTGDGFEYFKIWIVNIVLTILTLGIYSAWAKVRNQRYIYSNLQLDGHHFEYLANPITILKSRVIAVIALVAYLLISQFYPIAGIVLMIILGIAAPWFIVKSLAFNNRMTAYRNVQFRFHGSYGQAAMAMFVWPIVGVLTLGIMYPYALVKMNKFIVDNSAYGTARFNFNATVGNYFMIFLKLVGIFLLGFFMSVLVSTVLATFLGKEIASGIAVIPIAIAYLLVFVYASVAFANVFYNCTSLRSHGFDAHLEVSGMLKVMISNYLLIVLTLGLYLPAAKVRIIRYCADNITFLANGSIDNFAAAEREEISALGEEFGDVFDFDVGIA